MLKRSFDNKETDWDFAIDDKTTSQVKIIGLDFFSYTLKGNKFPRLGL